jgi:sulfotransferase
MAPRIGVQASLPRSGSTLLSNSIGLNPDFHGTPTSGVLDLLYVARVQ